jgi:hypothetical protein
VASRSWPQLPYRGAGPLIYYPFVILTLLILARSPLIDNWGTPHPLLLGWVPW